jgi:competence protein ComEA
MAAMPTPAERKALLFLAGVIVLGASVRVVRAAKRDGAADAATRQALRQQLAAVDSARGADVSRRGGSRAKPRAASRRLDQRRPRVRSAPESNVSHDSVPQWVREPLSEASDQSGRNTSQPLLPVVPIDLDVASAAEIEALPRIGPVLARRIVADRAANGPFGSIEGLTRVSGVGPSLASALRARVTFSGTARPSNAVAEHRLRSPPPPSKSLRRERRK